MDNYLMRIEGISIENFKNVKQGEVDLVNKKYADRASVLGLYGQNGSGKTALIDAIQVLKYSLCGHPLPDKYVDYINVDSVSARLSFRFKIKTKQENYMVWYQFCLRKIRNDIGNHMKTVNSDTEVFKTEIFDEILEYSFDSGSEKIRKSVLIDTRDSERFNPKSKYHELLGKNKSPVKEFQVAVIKKLAQAQSKSYIFSGELMSLFREDHLNGRHMKVLEFLVRFGNHELFIINTENSGLIGMDALPLSFKYREKNLESIGSFALPLNAPAVIPKEVCDLVKKIINNMNIVLSQLVPELKIDIIELDNMISKEGKLEKQVQIISLKNGKQIPFRYESEGIKKLVSVLQLLIVVYNNSSVTVAIDEMDSGIFEYLLGELLRIISEKGKGQLIFTSHNLRPLETLDKSFIAFTTTNPHNRYIRMSNVKTNNNLRDFYYRDIVLGEQTEEVYNMTNNSEIALAFREAGESLDS